jgi:hypothetical protein
MNFNNGGHGSNGLMVKSRKVRLFISYQTGRRSQDRDELMGIS